MDMKVRSDSSGTANPKRSARRQRGLAWLGRFLAPFLGRPEAPEKTARRDRLAFEALEPRVLLDATLGVPITRIDGSIDIAGETDRYGFTLTGDARVAFDSLTNSNGFTWSLSGPRGDLVSNRTFAQSDADYAPPVLQLSAGDYTLSVDGVLDATGNYSFRLIDLNAARAIDPEVPVNGTLDPANESDAFAFDVLQGDRFIFDRTSASANASWRLIDPFGQQVGSNHDFSDFDSGTLALAGRYTLLLEGRSGAGSATAAYSFRVLKAGERVEALTLGQVITSNLASTAQSARYDFSLAETGQYFFDSLSADARLNWSLRGPLGQTVGSRSFAYSDAGNYYGSPALALGPGNYSLYVTSTGDFSGDYAFRLANLNQSTPVNFATDTAGTLDPANGSLLFNFAANVGDRIAIQQTGNPPSQTVLWSVVDAFGRKIAGPNGLGGYTELPVLDAGGTYTLLFEGYVGAALTTDFSFRLLRGANTSEAINLGDTVQRSMDSPGQVSHFTFNTVLDTRVTFDALSADSRLHWWLYTSEGVLLRDRNFTNSDGFNSGDGLIDLAAGNYDLVIDPDADFSGAYAFRLLDAAAGTPVALGDSFRVEISNSGRATTVYNFDALSGDQVELHFDHISGDGNVSYSLFDPFGRRVVGASNASPRQTRLELTGRYTLLVEGYVYSGSDGSYDVFLNYLSNDGGNTLPAGNPIAVGGEVLGTLDASATPAVYNFTLTTDTVLLFDALGSDEYGLNWSLTGPRGQEVANRPFYSSDGGYYYYGLAGLTKLVAGDYALTINGAAGQAFDFRLVDARASATAINFNSQVSGALDPGNALKVFAINATAGDIANLFVASSWGGGQFLLDPDGTVVMGPTYPGNQDGIRFARTGTYLFVASGPRYRTAPANYQFALNLTSAAVTDIQLGDLAAGTITYGGEHQRYRFTVTDPQRVVIDTGGGNSDFYWRITGPKGVAHYDTSFAYGDGYVYGNTLATLEPGSHVIDIWTNYSTGNYTLRVVPASTATPITANTVVNGTLNPANSLALYSFDATAGERLTLDQVSSPSTAYYNLVWRLIGPSGQQVTYNYFSDFNSGALPETGKYLLVLEGNQALTGTAGFSFQVVRPVVQAPVAITLDNKVDGTLASGSQGDRFSFSVAEPTRVYFDYLSGSTGLNWTLTGPRGTLISQRGIYSDTADYGGPASIELAAGDYLLTIAGSTGAYSFRVVNEENKPVIAYGEVVAGQLSPGSEVDVYRFDAQAGDQVFVDVKPGPYQYSGYLRLLDPYGRQVASGYYLSDIDTVKLTYAGRYTLLVEGLYYQSGTSTSYSLSVDKVTTSTQAIDINTATGLEPVYVAAPDGNALRTGAYRSGMVNNDPALDLTGSLTIETRLRVASFANGWMPVVVKNNGNSNQRTYSLWVNSAGYVHFTTSDGSEQYVQSAPGSIQIGRAHV